MPETTAGAQEFLEGLRRQWLLVVLVTILCGALAAAYSFEVTPKYQSSVQLFVAADQTDANDLANAYQGSQFTTARVQSYVDLVNSSEISRPVVKKLHLNISPTALSDELSAQAPENTVLINLTATNRSPQRAQQVAQAVAEQLIVVIGRLEGASKNGTTPVRVSVSKPASLPSAPSSPQKTLDILAGVFVGLILGIAAGQIRERLDTRVRSSQEFTASFGIPVLGEIPLDRNASEGLTSLAKPASFVRVESLRALRTNLQFIDIDNPPHVLLVTSCLPGEGKSTTVSSLAAVIADSGRKVIVVEGDLRNPRLSTYMDVTPNLGIAGVMTGSVALEEALVSVPPYPNLKLLSAGPPAPNASEILGSERMTDLIEKLRAQCDMLLIDAPPLLPVTDAAVLAVKVDATLVVFASGGTSRKTLTKGLDVLHRVSAHIVGAVANKVASSERDAYYGYGYTSTGTEAAQESSIGEDDARLEGDEAPLSS